MKITEDNKYDLIDNYLSGTMDAEASKLFESLLGHDEELASEVSIIRDLSEIGSFSSQEASLRTSLENIHRESSKVPPTNQLLKFLLVFVILSGLLFLFFKGLNDGKASINNTNIQMAMVEPLEIVTKDDNNFKDLRVMQDLYNSGNYKSAYPYITSYLQSNPGDLDVILAKGISLMETQKFSDAHIVFQQIKDLQPRVLKYKWYMAVNHIKQGQEVSALQLLNEIKNDKSYNYENVDYLLKTIKK